MTGVLVRREEDTRMHTPRDKTTRGHKGEAAICKPRRKVSEKSTLLAPWSWTSSLRNCEQMTLCYFSCSVWGILLWQSEQTKRDAKETEMKESICWVNRCLQWKGRRETRKLKGFWFGWEVNRDAFHPHGELKITVVGAFRLATEELWHIWEEMVSMTFKIRHAAQGRGIDLLFLLTETVSFQIFACPNSPFKNKGSAQRSFHQGGLSWPFCLKYHLHHQPSLPLICLCNTTTIWSLHVLFVNRTLSTWNSRHRTGHR